MSKSRFKARGTGRRLGLAACMFTTASILTAPGLAAGETSAASAAGVTMGGAGSSDRVAYGERIRLAGQTAPGAVVQLEHAPAGRSWKAVSQTTAAGDGGYGFTVRARRSGQWRAVTSSRRGEQRPPRDRRRAPQGAQPPARARRASRSASTAGSCRASAGRKVRLEVRSRGRWRLVDRTRTRSGGAYSADFRPREPGTYRLRVRFAGDRSFAGDANRLPSVHVYTPGAASWYGPGFMGNRTACGGTLTAGVKGVAHRYLPCGTKVRFFYRGRSVTARVIDRGPFSGSRSWDLAPATKSALRFGDTGTVWAAY